MMERTEAEKIGVVPRKRVEVAIAVIFERGRLEGDARLLICRRKADTVLGGYWEFPGGKCLPGEAAADCAIRETREETGLEVRAIRELPVIEHEYPHAHVRLHPFICEKVAGELQLLAIAEAKWIEAREIGAYQFPEANAGLLRQIAEGRLTLRAADETRSHEDTKHHEEFTEN